MTGNSDLTRLDFGDNAVIDMEQAAGYQKLQTGTLNGDRGTFVLGADISTGQSDTVSIGSSDAKGTYNILVSEVGRRQGDDLHLLLVNDASGEHTFIASDIYRGGIYVYKTEISNEMMAVSSGILRVCIMKRQKMPVASCKRQTACIPAGC